MLNIIDKCASLCKQQPGRIVFTDALDERVIKAARHLADNKLAFPILLGGPIEIRDFASKYKLHTRGIKIQSPMHDPDFNRHAKEFALLKQDKGITRFDAAELIRQPLMYGAMMVKKGLADFCIAGNISTSADVMRAALQIIGVAENNKTVSSFFLMLSPCREKIYAFADCNVIPVPTPEQLVEIAVQTARNYKMITDEEPRVAMLSFSTMGSAGHPLSDKVKQAAQIMKKMEPGLSIDGEIQFDAAIIPEVAEKKTKQSPVAGKANVFIFPSLNAGNIGYKIAERIAGYQAVGPFLQGLDKPMHDLSRGCSAEDIINTSIVGTCMI